MLSLSLSPPLRSAPHTPEATATEDAPADVAARSRAEVLSRVAEARSENGEKPAAVPPGVTKGWRIGDKRNSLRDKHTRVDVYHLVVLVKIVPET